jgi:hypothetical protein
VKRERFLEGRVEIYGSVLGASWRLQNSTGRFSGPCALVFLPIPGRFLSPQFFGITAQGVFERRNFVCEIFG